MRQLTSLGSSFLLASHLRTSATHKLSQLICNFSIHPQSLLHWVPQVHSTLLRLHFSPCLSSSWGTCVTILVSSGSHPSKIAEYPFPSKTREVGRLCSSLDLSDEGSLCLPVTVIQVASLTLQWSQSEFSLVPQAHSLSSLVAGSHFDELSPSSASLSSLFKALSHSKIIEQGSLDLAHWLLALNAWSESLKTFLIALIVECVMTVREPPLPFSLPLTI